MTRFHQFEVTRTLRGSDEVVSTTTIIPTDESQPADGYWIARLTLSRLWPKATIRALGITTRQIWEVV